MINEELILAGFELTKYECPTGVLHSKKLKVDQMPYAKEHLVDGEYILGCMDAVIEVSQLGQIQFSIADADYIEGPYDLGSEEGRALLKDAGGTAL